MSSAASTTISTLDGTLEKRIMMEMEIQFSKGRTDRVLVHYDDDPAKIALVIILYYLINICIIFMFYTIYFYIIGVC